MDAHEPRPEDPPSTSGAAEEAGMDAGVLAARRRAGRVQAGGGARGKGEYGCKHYRRRVKFITPCCNEEWWCRHCHNEVKYTQEEDWRRRHELDRKRIATLVCAVCDTSQPVGDHCASCGVSFGAYSCLKCPFFDDDLSKKPYHCDDCGICRRAGAESAIGGRENFFHCRTCGSCYSVNLQGNHKCVERAMHQNCPVCFEFLFESVDPTTVLACGHTIHTQCLKARGRRREGAGRGRAGRKRTGAQDLEQNASGVCPMCPICKKSLGDYSHYWAAIDEQIERHPNPPEYAGWRADVMCNDCSELAIIDFHVIGLKCPGCGSYNTRRMGLHTTDGTPLGGEQAAGGGGGRPPVGVARVGGGGGGGAQAPADPGVEEQMAMADNLLMALFGGGGGGGGARGDAGQVQGQQQDEFLDAEDFGDDEGEEGEDEWETDEGEEEQDDEGEEEQEPPPQQGPAAGGGGGGGGAQPQPQADGE
eukprot:scaffold7.g3656.t1